MKIYTRAGDGGQTTVIGGKVDKDNLRVEAYGTIDELNSCVGQAVSFMDDEKYGRLKADLLQIQHELFDCGTDLAILKQGTRPYVVTSSMVEQLEAWIDHYDEETPDITRFILPGGSVVSSALHVCRTVCRRAERTIVSLAREQDINEEVRRYINRLSDLFFTVARVANVREAVADVTYIRSAEVFRNDKGAK